ncbi:Vesicular glutamate transporter 3 [Eumeta japonica]|uniref:Vesicular glutamate transporter 3 n=1 Tax=Eumeta variegata TaxID=151549 RepID=A0A4C1YZM3_EUMVA|nr:Vesicular glutamate transporter 3 [Eumeta japonica]
MYGTTLAFGWAADRCITAGVRVVTVRRLANTVGLAVSGVFLALFSMVRSPVLAEILLITCLALHSGIHVGFHINHIDLAPNFAGPLMSLGNMLANVAGLSIPALVEVLVHDASDQKQWQKVFLTMAGLEIVTNGIFLLLVRGEVQPWNDLPRHSITENPSPGKSLGSHIVCRGNKFPYQGIGSSRLDCGDEVCYPSRLLPQKDETRTGLEKHDDDYLLNEKNNVKERWKDYFESVFACEDTVADDNVTATEYMIDDKNESKIMINQITKALKRMKVRKAAGYDRLLSKMLRGVGEIDEYPAPKGFGVRHTQALLFFVCLSVAFMMRAHMGVTLVAMTANPQSCSETHQNTSQLTSTVGLTTTETYNWTKSNQDMIIFAFFVGYTSMMIPMGLAAHRCGGKATIVLALFVNGVVSLLTPWLPLIGGWQLVAVGRLFQGMTQATMYPSVHTLLARWAPLVERGRLSTYVYTGSHVGTVVAFQTAGQLAGSAAGWPATAWLCATLSLVTAALLAKYGATSPDTHPRISIEEKLYITGHNLISRNKKLGTPWRHILTSGAVWGLYAAHAGSAINYLFILTQTPVYMNRVIGLDIKTRKLNGNVSKGGSVRYHTLAEYRREVSLFLFLRCMKVPAADSLFITPLLLHRIFYSYPRDRIRTDDSSGGTSALGGGDNLFSGGLHACLFIESAI